MFRDHIIHVAGVDTKTSRELVGGVGDVLAAACGYKLVQAVFKAGVGWPESMLRSSSRVQRVRRRFGSICQDDVQITEAYQGEVRQILSRIFDLLLKAWRNEKTLLHSAWGRGGQQAVAIALGADDKAFDPRASHTQATQTASPSTRR